MQLSFIEMLYPKASPFERVQFAALNSVVALMGYYTSALLIDKVLCVHGR